MFDFGSIIQAGSNDFMNVRDQVHSAWFMNENQKEAGHQFDLQMQASNSAMQRRVEDLKAAGLNPMLGYTSQASAPSGMMGAQGHAVPSHSAPQVSLLLDAQRRNVDADTALKTASASEARARTDFVRVEIPRIQAEVDNIRSEIDLRRVQADIARLDREKFLDLYDVLIREKRAEVVRKEAGKDTLEKLPEAQRDFWNWLESIGHKIGQSIPYSAGSEKSRDPHLPY